MGREKIREFADAINDPNPAYRSVEAARALGHPDVVAPPTFPIVLTLTAGHQVIFDPEAGIDYARVVHGEQRFVHDRPVHAGDVLQVVVHGRRRAGGRRQRHGHDTRGRAHPRWRAGA